jgi:predicted MPP superfamily phosphohydrolase
MTLILRRLPLFFNSAEQFDGLERRLFLGVGLFSLATAAAGTKTAVEGPVVESVEVPLKGLPEEFNGLKIVQISDLHVGPTIDRDYAQRVVELTMARKPDLIVLTGDMIDGYPEELRHHLEPLRQLQATHGVFYCAGNHEYYWGIDQWLQEFRQMGFVVLVNESRRIQRGTAEICVGGLGDLRAHQFKNEHRSDGAKTFAGVPRDITKILLAHQPGSYPHALDQGVHLQLSGHTHGGQFFPFSIFVALTHKFYRGLYFHQDLWVYTNRGTGYWGPPQRFGIPPEITEIRLNRGV